MALSHITIYRKKLIDRELRPSQQIVLKFQLIAIVSREEKRAQTAVLVKNVSNTDTTHSYWSITTARYNVDTGLVLDGLTGLDKPLRAN